MTPGNYHDDEEAVPYSRIRSNGRGGVRVERMGTLVCADAKDPSDGLRRLLAHERIYPDGVECCAMDELAAKDEIAESEVGS